MILHNTSLHFFAVVDSQPNGDRIDILFGQPKVGFHLFSGYISIGEKPFGFHLFSGYISIGEKQERALFYPPVEAETKANSKPLVLWLNGGTTTNTIYNPFFLVLFIYV